MGMRICSQRTGNGRSGILLTLLPHHGRGKAALADQGDGSVRPVESDRRDDERRDEQEEIAGQPPGDRFDHIVPEEEEPS